MSLPKEDVLNHKRKEMLDMIAVMMAGRIAEELISGDYSTGAGGDIQQATQLARAMVCQYGMSSKIGMVLYADDDELFLGREMLKRKSYSEHTAQEIDVEVKSIIDEGFKRAQNIIMEHRDKLDKIAEALLEYETLEGTQVDEIVKTGQFTPPPKPPPPSNMSQNSPSPVTEPTKSAPPKIEDDLGTAQPAPA